MSLQVWLPLNGDLHNQGLKTYNSTATDYIIVNQGKIGKCIKCASAINTNVPASGWDFTTKSISFGAWIEINKTELEAKTSTLTYSTTYAACGGTLLGNHSYGGFGLRWITNSIYSSGNLTNVYIYATMRNTSGNIVQTSKYEIPFDAWTHVIVTFDREKETLNIYINGDLFSTKSAPIATYGTAGNIRQDNFYMCQSTWDGGNGHGIVGPWQFNDLRIYDHALDEKEVEEISKGLVLHYQLNQPNINLVSGAALGKPLATGSDVKYSNQTWGNLSGGNGTISVIEDTTAAIGRYIYRIQNNTSGNKDVAQYGNQSPNFSLIEGQSYTMSCYYRGNSTSLIRIWDATSGTQLLGQTKTFNSSSWVRITYTFTATSNMTGQNNIGFLFGITGASNGIVDICGMKVEKGNSATKWIGSELEIKDMISTIYDSSGYNHNGTIVGSLIAILSSPRYSCATHLECSSPTTNNNTGLSYIRSPFGLTAPTQMSVSWWGHPESGYGGSSNHAAWCTTASSTPSDYNSTAFHHRDARFDICLNSASTTSTSLSFTNYTLNEWHHYCVTYDGKIAILYKDGVETNRTTISSTEAPLKTFSNMVIGYSHAGGVWRKTLGAYADFRVYVTALTPLQVQELYNNSMIVDGTNQVPRNLL